MSKNTALYQLKKNGDWSEFCRELQKNVNPDNHLLGCAADSI